MSITDEITRIKTNIANAYTECADKGGVLPDDENSGNLASCISTITGEAKYNLSMNNFLGDVDDDGVLQPPVSGDLIGTGIVEIGSYALAYKFGGMPENVVDVWVTDESEEANEETGRQVGISSVTFPDLADIDEYGIYYFCTYSSDLTAALFPELTNV